MVKVVKFTRVIGLPSSKISLVKISFCKVSFFKARISYGVHRPHIGLDCDKRTGLKVNCVIFCFHRAHDGFIYPKTALVDEEDATFYGKESLSVDESCEVDVDEPSSDSPQLPTEFAHDTCQSKCDQGEFLLFLNEPVFFACLIFMLFVQQLLSSL